MEARRIGRENEPDRLLCDALKAANLAMVEEAIYKGANPLKGGYHLFELSMRKGNEEITKKILERASKEELNAFATQACINRQVGIILELQKKGAIIRVDDRFAKEQGETLKWMIDAGIKARILGSAIKYAENQQWTYPELLDKLIILMEKSEDPEKYLKNLDFLIAESAKRGKLNLLKFYESNGGNLKAITEMDIEVIKKKGEGAVLAYLVKKGVKIGTIL